MATISDIIVKDIEKRRLPAKHYAYIIEVRWSDGNNTMIGRQYSAFFDFQISLLETFPVEAGQKDPSQRVIPFLPGKLLFRRSNTRDVALKRMRPIAEYCEGIAKLPERIASSELVLEFFRTAPEDKELGRTKSFLSEKSDKTTGVKTANEITGPISMEKFVAIADYKGELKKELSLKSGDVIEVVEKKENGWWLAANEEGRSGWVPGVYLEPLYGEAMTPAKKRVSPGQGQMYEAICDFKATSSDELGFFELDFLEVLEENMEGWWYARKGTSEGWVPATYLQKSSSGPTPAANVPNKRAFDARAHWRKSIQKVRAPPPKRSMLRRTMSKDAIAKVQADYEARMKEYETRREEDDDDEEFAGIYETVGDFESTIPDGISFKQHQNVYVIQKAPGWWYGRIGNNRGWVPESYLKEVANDSSASRNSVQSRSNGSAQYNKSPKPPRPVRPPTPKTATSFNQFDQNPKTGQAKLAEIADILKVSKPEPGRSPYQFPNRPASPERKTKTVTQIDLTDYDWYRDITRQEAEGALLAEGQDGYFIVRPSKRGAAHGKPYSLTLFDQNVVYNFHIRLRADKKYAIGVFKETEPCFYVLPELIDHYKDYPMVIGDQERRVKLIDSPPELYATC